MKYQIILLAAIVLLGFFLRFVAVSTNPPGLYIDEASIGNNAYSILKTGKDEYGVPHPLWFKSFGDYKMPVYIYAVAGAMAILGKNELAVRIPSVIAGTITIFIFYLFLQKLLLIESDKKLRNKLKYLPLLASFLLAISSWHIQFSRGGFEVTVGTLFYLLAWYFFVAYQEKKTLRTILTSICFFILTMYTYHNFRVLTPLALLYIAYQQKIYKKPKSLYFVLFTILLALPIILFSFSPEGSERFRATSAFNQLGAHTLFQQIILYPMVYLNNYLSFFSFDFLFNFGDGIGRHQIPNFGELYRWQFPFFLAGIYFLLRQKQSKIKYITFLLFLSTPIAGALAVPSPHALRSLPLVISCMIFVSLGLLFLWQNLSKFKIITFSLICLIVCYEFFFYLHFYYIHYPKVNQLDWGAGYKQLALKTTQQHKYKYIVVDNTLETLQYTPIYFNFYNLSRHVLFVTPDWKKPKCWGNSPVLYIRPYYGVKQTNGLVANITLNNNDIYAQLWKLK